MNYKRIYNQLIQSRKLKKPNGYTETHHIVMKSMGGTNDPENLVSLTGREHWVAHQLLFKIHRNSKTAYACHIMAMKCEERGIPNIRNSYMYEAARKQCIIASRRVNKTHTGEKNSQYGTRWICNLHTKQNKKIGASATLPSGWIYGRNKWITIERENIKREKLRAIEEKKKLKESIKAEIKAERDNESREHKKHQVNITNELWRVFINGDYNSVRQFSKETEYSPMMLSNLFTRHISNYSKNSREAKKMSSKQARQFCN